MFDLRHHLACVGLTKIAGNQSLHHWPLQQIKASPCNPNHFLHTSQSSFISRRRKFFQRWLKAFEGIFEGKIKKVCYSTFEEILIWTQPQSNDFKQAFKNLLWKLEFVMKTLTSILKFFLAYKFLQSTDDYETSASHFLEKIYSQIVVKLVYVCWSHRLCHFLLCLFTNSKLNLCVVSRSSGMGTLPQNFLLARSDQSK